MWQQRAGFMSSYPAFSRLSSLAGPLIQQNCCRRARFYSGLWDSGPAVRFLQTVSITIFCCICFRSSLMTWWNGMKTVQTCTDRLRQRAAWWTTDRAAHTQIRTLQDHYITITIHPQLHLLSRVIRMRHNNNRVPHNNYRTAWACFHKHAVVRLNVAC